MADIRILSEKYRNSWRKNMDFSQSKNSFMNPLYILHVLEYIVVVEGTSSDES
jgi:hypothetical protein